MGGVVGIKDLPAQVNLQLQLTRDLTGQLQSGINFEKTPILVKLLVHSLPQRIKSILLFEFGFGWSKTHIVSRAVFTSLHFHQFLLNKIAKICENGGSRDNHAYNACKNQGVAQD